MRARWIHALLLAASVTGAAGTGRALQVPILVEELAPQGIPGRSRTAEPLSVGVPLSPDENVTNVNQLGFTGATAAQFRVLQRDPATQKIRWVLVSFLANKPGGGYALVNGSGSFGGPALATEDAAKIVVSTGPAFFEIRKSRFNVLDRVVRGANQVVASHSGGGVVVLSQGTRYESGLDAGSQVVVEDNGPVMAVVRASGTLRSAAAAASLAYTVRLYFHKGQSGCRADVTLRNGELASLSAKSFDAAWVEVPLALSSERDVVFGFPGTGFAGHLSGAQGAHLFQADNSFQRSPRTDAITPFLTSASGLEVVIGSQTFNTLGSSTDVGRGWMRLQDAAQAVLAGLRDMAVLFPTGFDVQGNTLAVELFSRYNPMRNLVFSWGAHETREIRFEFAAPGADAEAFRYRLQYPLFGRCDFARYRDTGGINGETRLVTAEEERRFFSELGQNWSAANYAETDIALERQYSFGTTGGGNQFDKDECELLDYLRTGYAGRFTQGRLGVEFKADQAVPHSDDFDYGTRQLAVSDVDVIQPASFHGKGARSQFDDEHPHWVCMLLYYRMTGDERIRDAIVDYGEWRRYRAGNPTYGAINGGALNHMRLWSRCFRDLALVYDLTGQARYLEDVRRMAQGLTGTIETGTGMGRSLERGYFYFGDATDPLRNIHLFFLTEMNAIGVQEALHVIPASDPLQEALGDYFYGLAYFTLEAQLSPSAIGYPYEYWSAVANPTLGTRGDQTGLQLAYGYEMSGDPVFADRCRSLAWRVVQYQHPMRASEIPTHVRIYRWLHRQEVGAVFVDPTVTRNADGSYTLRWNAPANARQYIVKYGAKPLVENLGFDQMSRTYRSDPAHNMNFWAAQNLQGEPAPGAAGSSQTFRTPPLPAGTWYFRVKVLLARRLTPLDAPDLQTGNPTPRSGGSGDPSSGPHRPGQPNAPQNPSTRIVVGPSPSRLRLARGIEFSPLPAGSMVRIYTVAGRLVREMAIGDGGDLVWDHRSQMGTRVAPGVYMYRIDMGPDRTQRGRVVLVP